MRFFFLLVAETGECLAGHQCSNASFAYGDLYANRPERIEEWNKRFGELEVKYINETSITIADMVFRNRMWLEEKKIEAVRAVLDR